MHPIDCVLLGTVAAPFLAAWTLFNAPVKGGASPLWRYHFTLNAVALGLLTLSPVVARSRRALKHAGTRRWVGDHASPQPRAIHPSYFLSGQL